MKYLVFIYLCFCCDIVIAKLCVRFSENRSAQTGDRWRGWREGVFLIPCQ